MTALASPVMALSISASFLFLGVLRGLTYGLAAVGLVLVFRSSRFVNFAHAQIGAFAAVVVPVMVNRYGVPYWIAFLVALAIGGAIGAFSEVVLVRRLRAAPRLMSMVATLGFAQFLLLFALVISIQAGTGSEFPQPPFLPSFDVGSLLVTRAHTAMLVLTPLLIAGLTLFLRRSRYGLAIRGAAENPEAATMAGMAPGALSTLTWAIAGTISAFTATLVIPTLGFVVPEAVGPSLLLRALAPAVVARMTNLPIAFGAGIAVGIVEQEVFENTSVGGVVELILFLVVLGALLFQNREGTRQREQGSWTAVQPWPALDERLRSLWAVRNLGWMLGAVALVAGVLLPSALSNERALVMVFVMTFALVGLSITVVTGLGGQLSLGQFAVAGAGALASYWATDAGAPFLLGLLAGCAFAGAVAIAVGLPALRVQGLLLAVTTLAGALAAEAWALQQPWAFGGGVTPHRPAVGGFEFDTSRRYYYVALVALVVGVWFTRNIRNSGFGRRLIAIRDNEDAARAFTVGATSTKLQAFALSGVLAGLGGAVYGHVLAQLASASFKVIDSIDVVAMTVIGGIGILAGPLLGALYIVGLPRFVQLDHFGLAATSLGWLVLILYFPNGLAGVIRPVRERLIGFLAHRAGIDVDLAATDDAAGDAEASVLDRVHLGDSNQARHEATRAGGQPLLIVDGLVKRYGGVHAVDGASLVLHPGETLGLIGPNGAGKTSLFEMISGFVTPDEGTVTFDGTDVTGLSAEARGRLGLIRSFQEAALFPTMTVLETVRLAHERVAPTVLWHSLLGLSAAEKAKEARARDLIALMGLDAHRDKQIVALSTGTRRIVEITCLLALEPRLLLLDEPAAGVAQRETESLGELLEQVKHQLDASLVIIEHDMPLISSLSDRLVAMESGKIIAEGTPAEVQQHPQVVSSFLGGDLVAIERSGSVATKRAARPATKPSPKPVAPPAPARAPVAAAPTPSATPADDGAATTRRRRVRAVPHITKGDDE